MSIRSATLAVAVLVLAGCGADTAAPAAAPAPTAETGVVSVVASTNVYGSIAEAVGGARVAVTSLVTDPAADPHSYESTPANAAAVAGSALAIYNGGGYDAWMPQLIASAGGNRAVIDVAELSGLATGEGYNEHFWYSLPTMQKLAATIATDLADIDPPNATEYRANAEAFTTGVGELLTRTRAIGAAYPGARVAITEPVPEYLIAAAGLTDATPPAFAEAIEEDTDPPAAVLQETLALFGSDAVQVLILNAQTETPTTDQVREAAQTDGVPIVEVTETLPATAPDYLSWMGEQIDALAAALAKG